MISGLLRENDITGIGLLLIVALLDFLSEIRKIIEGEGDKEMSSFSSFIFHQTGFRKFQDDIKASQGHTGI